MPDADRAKNSGRGKNGPLTVIRQFCLECQGASAKAVRACGDEDCPLWAWRLAVLAGELHERLAALDAALADADEELLRRTAHACKNSAGIMRLDQLRAAATAAEVAETSHLPDAARALRKAMIEASLVLAAEQNQEQAD